MLTDADLDRVQRVHARDGKLRFRVAVDLKCKDCIYDPLAGGTWRQQVEECRARECPLWGLRPRAYVPRQAQDLAESGQSEGIGA